MGRFIIIVNILLIFSSLSTATNWSGIRALSLRSPRLGIIGGYEVAAHSYPFQAGLLINGASFCSGSLISTNYVLTAAHCGEVIETVTVILGAHNLTNDNETTRLTVSGSNVTLHPDYDSSTLYNDIALIKLAETVNLTDYIKVAELPKYSESNKTYYGEELTAIGWGITEDNVFATLSDLSPVLRAVDVDVIDINECEETFYDSDYNITYVTSNDICTSGYKNRGTCNGDSGGPLVTSKHVVVGITSFGTDLCETCAPSVFARVGAYLSWISANSDVTIDS